MDYTFGHATHVGRVRDHNEDNYIALPEQGLWVVADGMGGHSAGEIASAIAVEVIAAEVANGCPLCESIEKAHQAILQAALDGQGEHGMGCTVVALKLNGYEVEVAWVGDSRAYLWDGTLRPLSRDHSFVQQLIDSGAISEEEARHHPQRSVITQALGASDLKNVRVDSIREILARGERLLLCSDGLTGEVDDAHIAAVLKRSPDSQESVEQLIAAANNNGGSDNVTVVLVDAPANAPRRKRKGDTVPMRAIGQGKGAGSWRRSGGTTSPAKKLAIALVLLAMLAALLLFWLLRSSKVPVPGGGSAPPHPMNPALRLIRRTGSQRVERQRKKKNRGEQRPSWIIKAPSSPPRRAICLITIRNPHLRLERQNHRYQRSNVCHSAGERAQVKARLCI